MRNRGLKILTVLIAVSVTFLSSIALAQYCGVTPEVIITLRHYEEGNYNVWGYVYGEKQMERFTDAVELPKGDLVIAGYVFSRGRAQNTHPLLVRVTRRNRMVWENRNEDMSDQAAIKKLRKTDDGFIAFGDSRNNKGDKAIWIGFFSEEGQLEKQVTIPNKKYHLVLEDITEPADNNGEGYVLAVKAIDKKYKSKEHGVIYRISPDGKVIWERSYKPGISNRFGGIDTVYDEAGIAYYIAVGSFNMDNYRRSGFILAVDEKGRLVWSKQYLRGLSSAFRGIEAVTDGDFAVIGDIEPSGEKYGHSAWIARIETESGDIQWERFVDINKYRVYGRKLLGYSDGRIIAAIDTVLEEGANKALPEMVRLLTLTPRGVIIQDEPYLEGKSVRISELKPNEKHHRMIIGYADKSFKADNAENPDNFRTEDGWIILAPSLDPYKDPCIPRRRYND